MSIDAETERLMRNWARWKLGAPIGLALTGAYELEARGRREESSIPLLNGEAGDVDQGVELLPEELRQIVRAYWLGKGTTEEKARRARCALRTFWRRLEHAHSRIREHLDRLRRRSRRVAEALGDPLHNRFADVARKT